MRLYHGSNMVVGAPDVSRSRKNLDFGQGFYLTSHFEQAVDWAKRKALLESGSAFVNVFEFDEGVQELKVLSFEGQDEEWVEFVCHCRRGGADYRKFDLIVGGVADDRVFYAVDMYYQGLWSMEQTLEALRFFSVNDQWCFVSQKVVEKCLAFVEAREVQ